MLVAVYCQVVGSVVPSAQARMRIVVGLAPLNCARIRMNAPGVAVRPVTRTSVPIDGLDVGDDGAGLDEHGAAGRDAQDRRGTRWRR